MLGLEVPCLDPGRTAIPWLLPCGPSLGAWSWRWGWNTRMGAGFEVPAATTQGREQPLSPGRSRTESL